LEEKEKIQLKRYISTMLPRLTRYNLFISTPDAIINSLENRYKNYSFDNISKISYHTLPLIEKSRPGYTSMAKKYLDNGHTGFCVVDQNCVASMRWLYYNDTTSKMKVSYFPLLPNRVWFHASWTNPIYRGKGLHKFLIYYSACYLKNLLTQQSPSLFVEANVDPNNQISSNNLKKSGFEENGDIYVLRFWRWNFSWKKALQ